MAQVIRATFWPLRRRSPQIQCFDFIQHTISPCINSAGAASSERLSFVALPIDRRNAHFRSHALRRRDTAEKLDARDAGSTDAEDGDAKRRSRNEKKREARQAVRWGMDLASFPTPLIKRILRAASLEDEEILGALMLAKRLGPDVREGKRRQFNYIGKLLRDKKPDLLGALIQATKDGDHAMIDALSGGHKAELDENEETYETEGEEEDEEEDSQELVALANKWFDGLVNKDIEISNEIYSISSVEFDRQELRKLVRKVQSIEERQGTVEENEERTAEEENEERTVEENQEKTNAELKAARRSLTRFLLGLAKQTTVEQDYAL